MRRPIGALALLWALPALLAPAGPVRAATRGGDPVPPAPGALELIHVEINEGGSSGGHAGLAIGDRVYHFQAVDGRLVLARPTWSSFFLRYSSLENRGLRRLPIEAAAEDVARIRAGLERRRLVQTRHLEVLAALEDERAWIASQLRGAAPEWPVRGAALFASRVRAPTPWAAALRDVVAGRIGAESLERLARDAAVRASRPVAPSAAVDAAAWRRDRWPKATPLAAALLAERLEWREAVAALADMRPLRPERLLDPLGASAAGLSAAERAWLEAGARLWEERIASLVRSDRPDRGRSLLVAIARHRAARRALAEDRFWTLDPFDDAATAAVARPGAARRRALARLATDLAAAHTRFRARIAAGDVAPDEPAWRQIEELAARHRELVRALGEGRALRTAPAPVVPWPRAAVAAPPVQGAVSLGEALRRVDANLRRVRGALDRLDGYDLFTFNCATELGAALEAPFADGVEEALGGSLDPDRGWAFIPARLFDRAARRLRSAPPVRLPSYRERRLASMRERENDLAVWLRESNTLSARSYHGSDSDGYFLVFTDGTPALRPVGGLINLSYGVGQAVAGLFTWPFDGGRRMVRGARGVFYSVPELFFVALRKGSYEYTEEVGARIAGASPKANPD
ncbi:MAG: hypothetical protein ACQGVK_08820 [Myxococcota bacterium]